MESQICVRRCESHIRTRMFSELKMVQRKKLALRFVFESGALIMCFDSEDELLRVLNEVKSQPTI